MNHQEKLQQLRELRRQLEEAEERLMIADTCTARWEAGDDYDRITAAIEDLTELTCSY